MAQGAIKTKKSSSGSKRSNTGVAPPKKGKRSIAPRKSALVKARGITKKYSSNLTNETERNLARKAGHLELLQGGKRNSGGAAGESGRNKKEGGGGGRAGKGAGGSGGPEKRSKKSGKMM